MYHRVRFSSLRGRNEAMLEELDWRANNLDVGSVGARCRVRDGLWEVAEFRTPHVSKGSD